MNDIADRRKALRGGRFSKPAAATMVEFSSSLEIDLEMLHEDIDGSVAHIEMLGAVGVVPEADVPVIVAGLERVREELDRGDWTPPDELEDVHMAVEARLVELIGSIGSQLHTARSRNDQVATDVRLWLKRKTLDLERAGKTLIDALLVRIETDGAAIMPGYTHLQRGQPIVLAHHLLAYAFAVTRDIERFRDALRRIDRSPLGACAMAGTPHPIDRRMTARKLGFEGLVENAMDAVSARDHEQEIAAACAICMTNLSRQAEELVLWSSSEFSFVRLSEDFATGSSIMPQKRNPDGAELVRGKAARVIGALQTLLVLVKGLPMAYNRDLQEDRQVLFDSVETTIGCLDVMAGIWQGLTVDQQRFEQELATDSSLATEVADELVNSGLPFREAHEVVGRMVLWCERHGRNLCDFPEAELPVELSVPLASILDPRRAIQRRQSLGGTSAAEIERQVALLRAFSSTP